MADVGTVVGGTVVSGGVLIWFAKFMVARLIKQYDEKLVEHDKRLHSLADKFAGQLNDLEVKLAKLEPVVATAISLKEDLRSTEGEVAVLEHRTNVVEKDLNIAFNQLRDLKKGPMQ